MIRKKQFRLLDSVAGYFLSSINVHCLFPVKNFVFGPVIMRMFHYLNKPKEALEAFTNPDLEQFFEQLASCHVLFDLLYKNEMYQEILNTFENVKKRQLQGQKFPRNITILVFAACYKLVRVQVQNFISSI